MEKENAGTATSSSSGPAATMGQPMPSAPPLAPPSAPPSYEEAVGLTSAPGVIPGMPMVMPTGTPTAPPYPMAGSQMPMPMGYATASSTQMPLSSQVTTNQSQMPEVRVIHQHVTVSLGPNPVKMNCPSCRADIKTTTMSDHQPSAHICCIILCLLGCCLCSCLPYCLSAFLSVHHFCPSCKAYIGTWKG